MFNNLMKLNKNIWLALFGLAFFVSCTPENIGENNQVASELLYQGKTMGTTFNVKVVANNQDQNVVGLQAAIEDALEAVNSRMSTYNPNSELSQFNRLEANQSKTLTSLTMEVIHEAIRISEQTQNALDITIDPLVSLWGFGPQGKVISAPSDEVIQAVKDKTGLKNLAVSADSVTKLSDEVTINLNAIAKGFGVDQVAQLLESRGLDNYLVEVGGEMRVAGVKPNGAPWRVAIEKPVSHERAVQAIIEPQKGGLATSGDYRNYFEQDGVRYSHLIDPVSGKPITHRLVSVTVITDTSMAADGYATALSIMGPERAKAFAIQHNLAVFLIVNTDNGFEQWSSESFNQYLKEVS